MPASAASMTASAANGGGTKITDALAPVFSTASATVLNTGQPSCVVPPLPGVTPPTTLVPYAAACFAWNVPSRPVMPWTMRRVFLSTRTVIVVTLSRSSHAVSSLGTGEARRGYLASATTFSAASPIVSAVVKFRPLSLEHLLALARRSCLPCG